MGPNTTYEAQQEFVKTAFNCPEDACVKTGYQYADISVPMELKPSATLGDIIMECCGEPDVDCRESKCGDSCEITITQKVSIKIPVHYQVSACVGNSTINCICDASCCQKKQL